MVTAATVACFVLFQISRLPKPQPPQVSAPPKSAPLRLTRASFSDLPGWDKADAARALASFTRGCARLAAKDPQSPMGGKGYGGTAGDWLGVCSAASGEARVFFETNFTPYRIMGDGKPSGLFTGYYEPQIKGSRTRQGAYRTPVYGLPSDIIRVDLSLFSPSFQGERISGKLDGRRLVPYAPRAEIDAKGLPTAKILFWTDDPVALFFLQIQGSGRVRFTDGSSARVGYAGENGRPYTAIGRILIAEKQIARENVSLASIRDWLHKNPDQAARVMQANQSFIFFEERAVGDEALGAVGTLGTALTPLGSLAIDPRLNVLGAPYYVDAAPVTGLLIGQDTGGAIRGAVRGDVFFGFGEQAEQRAGGMKASGSLFVLVPNGLAARLGPQKDFF